MWPEQMGSSKSSFFTLSVMVSGHFVIKQGDVGQASNHLVSLG